MTPHHLYWPDIDIDLAVESITNPEQYPLISQVRPHQAPQQPVSPVKAKAAKRKGRATLPPKEDPR